MNNENGNYTESLRILSDLDLTTGFNNTLKSMYYTTLADLYIRQKRYPESIDPLSKAIGLVPGKRARYRLTYLLAQLYELTGNAGLATANFQKVIRMHPPYEVEFYARINIAGVFDINSMDPTKMKRELVRMLKDSKNKDFLDQIYFALGNMSMKGGNEAEAVDYFRKSAAAPSQNQNQRGRSYLALANYFYNKPDFMRAGMYYDSTVYFLDASYPDYAAIKNKSQSLNTLVSQLSIIQLEDSLQKVAVMNEPARNALIASIITRATSAENERKSSEYADRYNLGQFYENERRFQGNIEQEGKWYFYNQAALTFGRTEFRRRWGDRKLEDNWRRTNKARVSTAQLAGGEENVQAVKDTSAALNDYKKPEFYLKNLPLTDSLMKVSNERIANAMLNSGKAYAEKIADPARATEAFESLINRYPASDLVPEALYNLYKVNKATNFARAEIYRQRLLQQYPNSEYARILSDPAYYEKKLAEMKMAENTYNQAYQAYDEERFNDAITLCSEGLTKYPKDILAPKFQLLHAYSVAKVSDERALKADLNIIIKTWPESVERKKAEEIIAYLNQKVPELKIEEDKAVAEELYKADTTSVHKFALVITDPKFNLNQATFDVISFNIDNFTNKNYRTEGSLVNNKYILITVSGFANYAQAMNYYYSFSVDKNIRNGGAAKMMTFIINDENLKILEKDGRPERYQLFFMENYVK